MQSIEYSKTGEYHKENNLDNQDYIYTQETAAGAFYAVADGASSCENSRKGAEIACKISAKIILDDIDYYFDSKPEKTINLILSNIRNKINKVAGDLNENEMSFASTLCFICVHKKRQQVMTFVLGDSKVFALYPESICPKNPVNAYKNNETCTVLTDFANEDVGFSIESYFENSQFVLCTDGCWKELFYMNEDNRVAMRSESVEGIEDYLESVKMFDDCSFLAVL